MKQAFSLLLLILITLQIFSQAIHEDERYLPETDPSVLEKLIKDNDLTY